MCKASRDISSLGNRSNGGRFGFLSETKVLLILAGSEIGACGCMGRYFPTRLPPEGRSKRGAPVGVLVSQNGGRRKVSLEKVVSGRVF